jgi:transcriptional regulator GlxA family with amidase domain
MGEPAPERANERESDPMMRSNDAIPASTDGTCESETVSELLAAATASLDTDRDAAKACIQRAAELLRSSGHDTGRAQDLLAARGSLALWQKQRLAAYIAANIGTRIRAADLAKLVRLSTGHFFRAFRITFGEPPMVYVTRERVRRSQELMLSSQAPLSAIALDCGMSDQSHLTRVFRRFVGVNPGVWRRQAPRQPPERGRTR